MRLTPVRLIVALRSVLIAMLVLVSFAYRRWLVDRNSRIGYPDLSYDAVRGSEHQRTGWQDKFRGSSFGTCRREKVDELADRKHFLPADGAD